MDYSERPDANANYTFIEISIERDEVDMASSCENMSSAIGPGVSTFTIRTLK